MTLEYTHNDDVADMMYLKDCEIALLKGQIATLQKRLEKIRTINFYAIEELLNDGF